MRRATLGALVALIAVLATSAIAAQERFGGLAGVVTDSSQAPVPGVTVTATNKQTGAARTTVTGSDGAYRIPDLEPGRYSVTIELTGFQKVQADDMLVLLGRTIDFPAVLKVGGLNEVVTVSADAEKQIDLRSTTIAHNVTAEEFDRMPKARSFQDLALTSPGVNKGDIEGGFQVNGASGAENSFTVDGVNTTSLLYGSSRQDTVFEYLQEVQVKTGGIAAEYGGALGGVISAVTKSGGNKYTGEAHYYFSGSPISASPVPRLQLSPLDDTTVFNLQDETQKNLRNEVGGSLGGPIVRDRLFFFASVSPRFIRRTNDYLFSNGTEPGSISQEQTATQAFGKVTYGSRRLQANVSVLATPIRSTGTLTAYDGTGPQFLSSSLAGNAAQIPRGYDQDQTNVSGNVDYFISGGASISVRGGIFRDNYKDTGVSTTTAVVWNTPSIGVPGVPGELQLPKGSQNTPRVIITNKDQTETGFFQIDYNHAFNAAGSHLLKGGVGVRHTTNDVDSAYPGGYVLLNWGTSFVNNSGVTDTGTYGYYEVNDRGTRGSVNADMPSLYVQDTWTLGNRLTLNLGVRTEKETLPSFRTDIKDTAFEFGYGKKIAPRLGATYDVLGNGRLKAFGSWGRYYDWVKYELARGSFGGDTWLVNYRSLDTLDVYNLNLSNMPGRDLWGGVRDRRVPNFNTIDPDLKPMFQDSTNAGIEYQLTPTTALGVNYVHNKLTRAIEDVGSLDATGNEVYFAANPGEGVAQTMAVNGLTTPFPTPKPLRQYDAVDVTHQPPLLEQLVRQRQPDDQPAVWQLLRAGQLRRDHHSHHRNVVGRRAAADRQHRPRRHGRRTRLGPRRARVGLARQPRSARPPGHGSPGGGEVLRLLPAALRHAARRLRLRRQRHADEHRGQHHQHHPGAGQRPRRHGPHAVPDPDRSARLPRARPGRRTADAVRVQRDQPVQPEDRDPHLQLAEQGRRSGAGRFGDEFEERRSGAGLRLQRADPGEPVGRQRL